MKSLPVLAILDVIFSEDGSGTELHKGHHSWIAG